MGRVMFYHLTRSPAQAALTMLLERSLMQGWRVALRCGNADRLEALDTALWDGPADSFLPHGLAGGDHDALQPVLLSAGGAGETPANGAVTLFSVDGAEVAPEEVAAMEATRVIFDGRDEAALTRARGQWKALTAAGCQAEYWSEESGRWEKKAESAAKSA